MMSLVEWLGAVLGIAGALMISMNRPWSKHAWFGWTVSNVLLIVVAASIGAWGIFAMQSTFLIINASGIWHWVVRPSSGNERRIEG